MVNPLEFLRTHQPLPLEISPQLQVSFTETLLALREKPAQTEEAVPLLLNCWNDWDGGHHQEAIIATLKKFPAEWVGPHVAFGLRDEDSGRRMWFAEVARAIPWFHCVPELLKMLRAEEDLERFVAACALEVYDDPDVREQAAKRILIEQDEETVEVLEAIVARV